MDKEKQLEQTTYSKSTDEISDVTTSTKKIFFMRYRKWLVSYFIICSIITIYSVYYFSTHNMYKFIFVAPIILLMPLAYIWDNIYKKVKIEFQHEIADYLHFTYSPNADNSTVQGSLFSIGKSQVISDVFSGQYNGIQMRFFLYSFLIRIGTKSQNYGYTVFEATLNGNVPNILLSSWEQYDLIKENLTDTEIINLEGDFHKYFSLRVQKGFEIEAYQIFTPDIMANLIDKARDTNFEFIGNKLYIFTPQLLNSRSEYLSKFSLAEYLIKLFQKNFNSITIPTP